MNGAERIAKERARQLTDACGYDDEKDDVGGGWTAKHDDAVHYGGQLALAAACYAAAAASEPIFSERRSVDGVYFVDPFPWSKGGRGAPCEDARPYNGNALRDATDDEAIRLLEKAGALCAAEIDRLLRKKASGPRPLGADCTCYYACGADSHSGGWHQHEGEPCPDHPDAPMVG